MRLLGTPAIRGPAGGRHDWICPVEGPVEIAGLLRGAVLHICEGSGHAPHVEESGAFLASLRNVLTRVLEEALAADSRPM